MSRSVDRIASFIRVGGNAIAVHRSRAGNTGHGNEIPQRGGIPRTRKPIAAANGGRSGFTENAKDPMTIAVTKAIRDRTRVYEVTPARTYSRFAGARYRASRVPVSCSRRTQYPMSQSIRETTMNVFDPISMYRRKSAEHLAASVEGHVVPVYAKKFVAAVCSSPATAVPRRIGRPAKITGRNDSSRIAPL